MASKLEIVRVGVWIFIIMCNIDFAMGDLLYVPTQEEVIRGDNITIPCATTFASRYDVHWQHTPVGSNGTVVDIFFTGFLIRKFQGKYSVEKDKAKGEYNLTILYASANDAGSYTCIDKGGTGQQRRTELIVLDTQPIGRSNVSLDHLTICGPEADYIGFSCHINYAGDQTPNIEWRQIFKNGTDKGFTISSKHRLEMRHSGFSLYLSLRTDSSMDGSVLRCQTTLSKYGWTSDELQIQYAMNSSFVVSLQEALHVECQATTNQKCRYQWSQTSDLQNIQSENATLELAGVPFGTYTCMADCNIRRTPCIVFGQTVQYDGDAEFNNHTIVIVSVILVSILLMAAAVLVTHMYCFVRGRGKPKENAETTNSLLSANPSGLQLRNRGRQFIATLRQPSRA